MSFGPLSFITFNFIFGPLELSFEIHFFCTLICRTEILLFCCVFCIFLLSQSNSFLVILFAYRLISCMSLPITKLSTPKIIQSR